MAIETPCQSGKCEAPGYCEYLKRHMVGRLYDICSGTAKLPEETRDDYISGWLNKPKSSSPARQKKGGAGTELKKLLSRIGIKPNSGCKCNSRVRKMDERGVQWCEKHLEKILGWLKEESQRRRFPFIRTAALLLVKRAIRTARLNEERQREMGLRGDDSTRKVG